MNDGRRPESVSASRVNCDITSNSPPTWRSARFILPSPSANTRMPMVLSAMWAAIAGIACSRLYSVIDNFPAYMHDPWSIIFSGSGFVWYGGLIGGLLSSYFVSRYYKVDSLTTADMAGPALVIGQALGRIGCL